MNPDGAATEGAGPGEPQEEPFSDQLERWLKDGRDKTFGSLGEAFGEGAFAVTILLLMVVPALPLPTGGVSHAFEVITVVLALQMVAGRHTIWLPRRWAARPLGGLTEGKTIPVITRWLRRFERISHRRGARLLRMGLTTRLLGLILAATAVTALLAPPFSGLDTLPGLAAVLICMGMLLADVVLVGLGLALEVGAVVVMLTIGATALHWIRSLF